MRTKMKGARPDSGAHPGSIESRPSGAAHGSFRSFLFYADSNIEKAMEPA
jgi:hypothetical protein